MIYKLPLLLLAVLFTVVYSWILNPLNMQYVVGKVFVCADKNWCIEEWMKEKMQNKKEKHTCDMES